MTNAFFDQAKATAYRGGFKICATCITVVPTLYFARHEVECNARHEAANAYEDGGSIEVADLEQVVEQAPAGFDVTL